MIRVKPTFTTGRINRSDIAVVSKRQARYLARLELVKMGVAWEREVRGLVAAEAPRRSGNRHKENTTHLENSFDWRIEEGPDNGFPMRLVLTIKPGVSAKKIGALEYGVDREYTIEARDAEYLRWGTAPGDLTKPFQKSVTWKPTGQINQGYAFMRRARDRVVARRRNSRV